MNKPHQWLSDDHRPRIGEYLWERGLLTRGQVAYALDKQRKTGERLGSILIAEGFVSRRALHKALADIWELPFTLLTDQAFDPDVLERLSLDEVLALRTIPLRVEDDVLHVGTDVRPDAGRLEALRERYGVRAVYVYVTTDWDVDWAIRTHYRGALLHGSIFELFDHNPMESSYNVFTRRQYLVLVAMLVGVVLGLYVDARTTLITLNVLVNLLFLGSIGFKFWVSLVGARTEQFAPVTDDEVAALEDDELPMYTILVPVYREANIIGLLMRNLADLDYPKEKVEILVLIEEDDPETLDAAKASAPPHNVQFVLIPHGHPKTKPKACNVGLYFARGEYLVIFDAEDRPEPDQLKKALVAFRKGDPSLVCVQCALNYFNAEENLLTRMFTLEYSFWFDYMLPGLQRLGLPIPLGGTSNHFRTDRLRELAGWDPFNVTEDADLGIRASMHGYTVGVINSTTFEEANNHVGNWIRQRSRWIKGYMQTTLVHSRRPIRLIRKVGWKQALGFGLLIGGTPLTFLLSPLLWALFVFWMATGTEALDAYFPTALLYASLFSLIWGNALAIYLNMLAVFRRKLYRLVPFALGNPIYWMLHARASYKALVQLFTKPFFWEKTDHGLTNVPTDHVASAEPIDDVAEPLAAAA